MNEYDTYLHVGRLVVLVQFILIPTYFYLLSMIFVNGVIWFLNTPDLHLLSDFIVYGIGPLVMGLPFLMWTYGRRYKLADAYESFGREVLKLPTTIKAFYGFNFVIGLIFLIPILTPVVSLFGGYFIAVYLFGWIEKGKFISRQRKTILFTLLYLPLPLLVIIGFYFGYDFFNTQSGILGFFLELYNIWINNIEFLYTSALIIADAVTVGAVLYLVYEGAQQVDYTVDIPELLITIISAICFLTLETLYITFPDSFTTFLGWIHIAAAITGIILLAIRYWKGLTTSKDTSIMGWLTLVIFQIVNFVSGTLETISRSTAIALAFSIFLFLFLLSYRHATKRY